MSDNDTRILVQPQESTRAERAAAAAPRRRLRTLHSVGGTRASAGPSKRGGGLHATHRRPIMAANPGGLAPWDLPRLPSVTYP